MSHDMEVSIDELREALEQIGGPAGKSWGGDHYLVRSEVIAAARSWLNLLDDDSVVVRQWPGPIALHPKGRPDLGDDLPPGQYLIVPVAAVRDRSTG